MPHPTQRFSDRVENYVRYRPTYPADLIQCLQERAGLGSRSVVADIGSGTGILTALLLPLAQDVHAIEPNAAMRSAAEAQLNGRRGFHSGDGTAESTGLVAGSVDLVTAAQAFHWFDVARARREFVRILKPGGAVALIWNERLTDTTPFLKAYERLLESSAQSDYAQVNHTQIDAAAIGRFFSPAKFETHSFPNEQVFDLTGLNGRALSSSYVPNSGQPGHEEFMAGLKHIFEQHAENGQVAFHYRTQLYLGALL